MALIPLFPTFWYLIGMAAIFGAIDGFTHLTAENFIVLGGIFLLSVAVEWSAGFLGAKFGGAGWRSLLWGGVCSLVGLILLPPFGAVPGLFLGVLGSELYRKKDGVKAVRAAGGALLGTLTGIILNTLLAVTFVILFIIFAVF